MPGGAETVPDGRVGRVAWSSAKRREQAEQALDNPGVVSCGVCGRRWERPSLRWARREFEEHDCPAGEAARTRRAVKAAEREVACEACGWVAVTEKYRGPALLAEHLQVCPNKPDTTKPTSA